MENNNMQPIRNSYLLKFKAGNSVEFIGGLVFEKSSSKEPLLNADPKEICTILNTAPGKKHPYLILHGDNNYWIDESLIKEPLQGILSPINPIAISLSNKYFEGKIPFVCLMTNSICFKQNRYMKPKGIVWNSTGVNKPYLFSYIQPDINDPHYDSIIKEIGINDRGDDYNHTLRNDGYNAWIGRNAKGRVISVQTLPWTMCAAGAGEGEKGSIDEGWIQINICEDALNNRDYFYAMYEELIHLTAYLCELYNIDPFGTNSFILSNIQYPTLLDHQEAYKLGVASPRLDVFHWFKKYDKNMRKAREDVAKLIANTVNPYSRLSSTTASEVNTEELTNNIYTVVVDVNKLNIRQGPGKDYDIIGTTSFGNMYLIQEDNGWGKLIEQEGWIDLQFTKRPDEPLE